jgi:hypothetical protein
MLQIPQHLWTRMRIEIRRRTDNGGPAIRGYAHCDHVFLDLFAKVNARVEALRDDIPAAVICGDIENNVRVLMA